MPASGRHLDEVESRIKAAAPRQTVEQAAFLQNYHGTSLPVLGIKVPEQRRLFRRGYSFSDLPVGQQIAVWGDVWRGARHYETTLQAAFLPATITSPDDLAARWPALAEWSAWIDGWAQSDSLSAFYVRVLEAHPDLAMPVLREWNRSANPWQRRQSIVSLLYYAGQRTRSPDVGDILALVDPLLADADHFVQRGVGWTLREAGTVNPKQIRRYLEGNAARLSATAFSAASEKLDCDFKDELKAIRKAARGTARRA